jgi:hypothetical protein
MQVDKGLIPLLRKVARSSQPKGSVNMAKAKDAPLRSTAGVIRRQGVHGRQVAQLPVPVLQASPESAAVSAAAQRSWQGIEIPGRASPGSAAALSRSAGMSSDP